MEISTAEEITAFFASEISRWGAILKETGLAGTQLWALESSGNVRRLGYGLPAMAPISLPIAPSTHQQGLSAHGPWSAPLAKISQRASKPTSIKVLPQASLILAPTSDFC
jgi:hypothetical protein